MKNSGGNWNKKGVIKCLLAVVFMIAAIVSFTNSKSILSNVKQFFAAGDVPAHEKTKTDNTINGQKDGTYKLSLTVKGDASTDKTISNANVLVVFDTSNSMSDYRSYIHMEYDTGRYGLVNGSYVNLYSSQNRNSQINNDEYDEGTVYVRNGNNFTEYTGQRYVETRRADAGEKVIYDFTKELFKYQDKENNPENIQMALISFNHTAHEIQGWTSSESDMTEELSSTGLNGTKKIENSSGTNYEVALQSAINDYLSTADKDPTFVIFFTDGAPTQVAGTNDGTYLNPIDCYNPAKDEALAIQRYDTSKHEVDANTRNTTLYGIYAYGDEADYLDDIIYYAHNGTARTNERPETDATDYYYNASDTAALNAAIKDIFSDIVDTLGISNVSIKDGTTANVKTSQGVSHLLEVDTDSFEYWLSMPINNNEISRVDISTGETYKILLTDNGDGTFKASSSKWNDVTITGTIEDGVFKYKWTESNNFYKFAPPAATFNNTTGSVDWDLSGVGTLLDGVTYEVTFDVYPSQTTYDYIADLENGVIEYSDLPTEVQQYLHQSCTGNSCSYSLETNTQATLSYDDTRDEAGTQTVGYTNPDPVPTIAETISISKEWDNTIDKRDKNAVDVKLLKSKDDGTGFEDFCFTSTCKASLNEDNNYKIENISIATGLARLKDGQLTVLDKGHDYKFDELGSESYYWQLETEVVHPMIINGVLTKLILVEDESIVSQMGTATYKEIGGKKYYQLETGKVYVDAGEGPNIKAENHRRSNLNVTKIVDGPTADPDEEFTFIINVVQKDDEGNVIPSTDTTNHNDYLWFSVMDASGNSVILDETPNNWTPAGTSYYAPNETSLTVKLKAGYNLRFFNLHTGSTFTVTETDIADYKLDQLKETEKYKETADGDLITNTIQTIKDSNTLNGTINGNNRTYTVEAKNIYEKVSAKVKKEWPDDNENAEGLRQPITFNLKDAEGNIVDTVVLDGTVDENGETAAWFGEFEDQTRFVNGQEVTYTVEEDLSEIEDHYTSTISPEDGVANNGLVTVTNNRNPDDIKTSVEGTKTWEDNNNQDDLRPATITINLIKNGSKIDSKVVTLDPDTGEGKYSWTDLPKYENGDEIVYSVTEEAITYYEPEYISGTYDIKNKHNPFTTELSVTKSWVDAEDIDGIRPDSVAVQLYVVDKNGNELPQGQPVTLNEANNWSHTFDKLARKAAGEDIKYIIKEVPVPTGYTETYTNVETSVVPEDGSTNFDSKPLWTVKNTHTPEKTDVSVKKVWEDAGNQDGIRPTSVQVQLYKDGTASGDPVTLNEANEWTHTWTDLAKYEFKEDGVTGGQLIEYTVQELTTTVITGTDGPETYAFEVTGDVEEGYTVTNTHTPQTTEVPVVKVWEDADDQDGIRPESIDVQLYADGTASGDPVTLNEGNEWTYTWTDLAKNKNVNGTVSEIVYTVDETTVPTSYSKEITGDATEGFTITNKYTPGVVQVSVEKEWDDSENQDGIRPTSVEIQLFADGEESGKPITLNSENSWKYTWNDLPEKASGQAITYTVEEIETDVITGTDGPGTYAYKVTGDAEKGFTVKNTHTPDETEVSVTKVWVDGENQDGIRPGSVQVQLFADGEESGEPVTLNESNSWTHTWEELAVNKTGGNKITYTVQEITTDVITGTDKSGTYAIAVTGDAEKGFTVTNTHTPDETEVSVEKKWEDKSNQDGIRPGSVQVQLLADGQPEGEPVTLNSRNSWKHTWEELAVNKTGGKKITYTVQEITTDVITGTDGPGTYAIDITGDAEKGFTVKNTHTPDETEVSVEKKWEDKSNQDGIRPTSVQVQLLADGEESGEPVTLNSENNWKHTWEELAVNNSGNKITYTVQEITTDKITGTDGPGTYAIDITGDAEKGFTVTNTHTPETTEVPVTKEWADAEDQDGIRPDDIEVQLFADGKELGKAETLNEENEWTYTWTKLDKFKDGKAIAYTVDEVEVPEGYTKESITGDAKEGFVIKNTHVTEDTAVKVTKKWADAEDQDGIRPDSVEVQLYADGTAKGDPVSLNETNEWTKVWSKLDKFKDGEEIKYTVKETTTDVITGKDTSKTYAFEVTGAADTGYIVTNTHTPETTSVSGNKTWDDSDNQDGLRPESITINLLADGQLVNSKEFPVDPETGKCEYSFTTDSNGVDLPKYRDGGTEIVYTITENRVSDYEEPTYDGLDVTNKHNPFETEVSVKKSWDDEDDIDGKRPKFIYVTLYADDIPYAGSERVRLDESNGWSYTWSKLPRKASGTDIVYTVRELVVPEGYTSNVENPAKEETPTTTKDGTTYIIEEAIEITNNHTPDETEVSVEKKWEDNNNQDGIRPAGVEIKLLADGKATDYSVVLSEQNEWKHTWTGLQKYEFDDEGNGGKEIAYTVEESPVPDKYTAEVSGTAAEGFTVTNKYTPEETSLKVTKVWDDQGDQDGIRPQSIQVQLTADGTAQGDPITLDESNNWTYTWTGLAKNKNVQGDVSAITYKADEVAVPQGYEKTTTGDMTKGITITNKYTPKVTNVEGTKTWDDSNNVDGKRPSSITVYVKDGDSIVDTITVTGDATAESWIFKSKDLPKYRNHGKEEIKYTIEEETKGLVEIGYSVEINGTNITNKRTPEVIEEFPITKSWIDNSNSEGFRPNSVDIQLLADGQPYGDPITIGTDKDGNPLEGTTIEGNNWKYVFKNLPKYTHDEDGNGGKEIVYSIKEVNLDANYKAEQVDNRTIVNTIDAMKKDIPVKKIWDDASNQDGYRPDSIEFTLTGTVESEEKPVYTDKITLNGDADTWEGKFVDAPIFYKGTLITYTINEVVTKDLTDYYPETTSETVDGIYTITNKHTPEVTEVTIGKTWDDKDDQDGKRPSSIEVTLTGNGKTYGPVRIGLDENENPLEGTEVNGNTWTYTFTGLPKKADGKDIEYVVSESNVDNYNQLSIISNVITNQHIPATISYEVEKEWKDYDNQDGKRPEFITVTLTGKVGDTVVYTSTITVKPDENGDWKYSFTGLNKYYQKQLIQYTLTEGNVDLYETDPIVDIPNEEGTTTINNTIINRHELETIDITVKKVWDDLDNKYNHRTTFVTVHLFADGEEVKEAMLSEANGWTTIFEGLVKYREGKEGEEVVYTITEDAVEFYKTSIAEADNVFTITNTYDGPTESEIVPPKTGILPTKDYTFFELLMNLILLSYSLVYLKKVEN